MQLRVLWPRVDVYLKLSRPSELTYTGLLGELIGLGAEVKDLHGREEVGTVAVIKTVAVGFSLSAGHGGDGMLYDGRGFG